MVTTAATDLGLLLAEVDEATVALRTSPSVPDAVVELVDRLDGALGAEAPLRLHGDPYLTTMLFAAAFRSAQALRHDDPALRRRELRVALEQFRHSLRDLVTNRPFESDTPVREVLSATVAIVSAPQRDVADLLGVSVRQLQRWLSPDGTSPAGRDEARIRVVGQLANQLRHTFTGPGVIAWFQRVHPVLGIRPVDWLDDPLRYPELLAAATSARAMTG